MDSLVIFIKVYGAIGGVCIVAALTILAVRLVKKAIKPPICLSCKKLESYGGKGWKYTCRGGRYQYIADSFDRAPKYCVHYEPKED